MLELSQKAHQDGRALKTITLLTLVYLPATFVAVSNSQIPLSQTQAAHEIQTLLSMNYIKFTSQDGHIVLELANEMWIFTLLTVVLLVLTMGYRKYWECRQAYKAEKLEEVNRKCCSA